MMADGSRCEPMRDVLVTNLKGRVIISAWNIAYGLCEINSL